MDTGNPTVSRPNSAANMSARRGVPVIEGRAFGGPSAVAAWLGHGVSGTVFLIHAIQAGLVLVACALLCRHLWRARRPRRRAKRA